MSTSKRQEVAESFMNFDKEYVKERIPVLFIIKWSSSNRYWDCTNGQYSSTEFEVLLFDGEQFTVKDVN